MVTESHKKSPLSPAQKLAIFSLASGARDEEAARTAKVSRETVSRWKNRNPHFQAALNKLQLQVWEGHQTKLLSVVSDAIETIKEAVKKNPSIAMKILEKCRGLNEIEPPTGPTTVDGILRRVALKRAQEELTEMRRKEGTEQLLFANHFEEARQLRPLIKKHFSILKEKYAIDEEPPKPVY
jgi:hypothetical protein